MIGSGLPSSHLSLQIPARPDRLMCHVASSIHQDRSGHSHPSPGPPSAFPRPAFQQGIRDLSVSSLILPPFPGVQQETCRAGRVLQSQQSLCVSVPSCLIGLFSLPPLCLRQTQNAMYDLMSELHAQHEDLEARLAALESRLDALGTSLQALPSLIAQAIRPLPPPLPPRPGLLDQAAQIPPCQWPPVAPSDCG